MLPYKLLMGLDNKESKKVKAVDQPIVHFTETVISLPSSSCQRLSFSVSAKTSDRKNGNSKNPKFRKMRIARFATRSLNDVAFLRPFRSIVSRSLATNANEGKHHFHDFVRPYSQIVSYLTMESNRTEQIQTRIDLLLTHRTISIRCLATTMATMRKAVVSSSILVKRRKISAISMAIIDQEGRDTPVVVQ